LQVGRGWKSLKRPFGWVWATAGLLKIVQWTVALLAIAGVLTLAALHHWPFTAALDASKYEHPTLWQLLLADRFTLGLVRLALVALGLYVIVSVPALAAASRWVKGFGKEGLTADDAAVTVSVSQLQSEVRKLTTQLRRVTKERDEAIKLNERLLETVAGDD
jgi:hypothetical protein